MLNIVDLERRWVKYKIKYYIPHVSIFISLIIISSITVFIFSDDDKSSTETTEEEVVVVTPQVIEKKVLIKETPKQMQNTSLPSVIVEETIQNTHPKKVQLSPSLGFMRKMQNSVQPYYKNEQMQDNTQTTYHQVPIPQKVNPPKVEVVEQQEVLQQNTQAKPEVKKISIKRQNTQNDIYEIIARFKKNSNPALSLFVAKKYYELGDYEQAYNYALITNKINKNIESSWIIFTKSLVKLGKRDQAIATLKQYIKQSHSSAGRILLDEIYGGRFK